MIEIPEELQKLRINFLLDEPFLGHFMSYRPDDFSDDVPSAGTNGCKTVWNKTWFDSLTSAEQMGVKRHEAYHDLLEHSVRFRESPDFYKNHKQANVAMDVIVNAKCLADNAVLPESGILPTNWPFGVDDFFKISRMSLPQAYEYIGKQFHCDENEPNPEGKPELPEHEMDGDVIPWEPEGDGNGEGDENGEGSSGDKSEDEGKAGKGPTPEQVQQKIDENKKQIAQALSAGLLAGTISGDLEKQISELLRPKLKWTKLLTNMISRATRSNYAWFPSNRRFIHKRMHLPSMVGQSLGNGVWITDTSGSVDVHTTNEIDAELKGMFSTHEGECTIISADTDVKNVEHMNHNNAGRFKPTWLGGGGTNYRGAFRWIRENMKGKRIDFCIYATDGHCSRFPEDWKPNFPVYWVLWDSVSFNPPFGKVIYVN